MSKMPRYLILFVLILLCFVQTVAAQTGKRPVIVIPGITGSEMVNAETGEKIWFTFSRPETDDLRLPMSTNLRANRDKLVAKDIIREIKLPSVLPDVGIYDGIIKTLKERGYTEASWDAPQETDVFYVFAYDWRRDNVETAQLLMQKVEAAKTKLGKPDLKFEILAHSMGGLIARYAAMYGAADLPAGNRQPALTWAGAKHFYRILMFGVPNEGSMSAFSIANEGYTLGGRNLPFLDDLTRDDIFTIPSLYQLLPHRRSARFYDENLKPIAIDLYNPATWRKYGWGAVNNPKFQAKLKDAARIKGVTPNKELKIKTIDDKILSETTYAQAQRYFAVLLARARRFNDALDVKTPAPPIEFLAYGGNCDRTLDAVILVRDAKKNTWLTITEPDSYKTSAGRKITDEEVAKVIYADGDGRVTRSSLLAEYSINNADGNNAQSLFPYSSTFFFCAPHYTLLNNETIQANLFSQLLPTNTVE
jgi:hypothetical protein